MAKQREYHNLAGFLRDVAAAIAAGHELAHELWSVLDELEDTFGDTGLPGAEDAPGEGSDDGLDLPDQPDLPGLGGAPPGHGTGEHPNMDWTRRLGDAVERLVALETARGRVPSDTAHLASAFGGPAALKEIRNGSKPQA